MQFRVGNTGPSAGIGCGGIVFILGLILVSPVGEWLIKGIGWLLIIIGVFISMSAIYLWMKGTKQGGPFS
ncbi:MAG: hypothetical protein VX664_09190 [Chloroflexota bacterium]|uniref:Uncharacterized protein n=1 Tax=marine metagenome TaxID=408172 RepID=A0A381QG56_9ZZZZ|nr:hypothetical protein [Chloroflexota bacterium]